ncbi:MAG TPA: inosine/xanthosine triphosphatase [Ignavibacteriales bacterium]|nr:inosine/xanthosine triphosphatase [Ignavibacteriales bacterium]HOL80893.1 inosine/xanthosine triphosphatase [Ignavibacteriales bacterium]HOM65917.1 inosine/xanthosine triphosphatase [Ignavibacteriales bacterium]HPD67977.1 inosine/xanthosine triphosphatase [Ignavibacteriales bacterium]HPP33328.1 inosine/xanthosine triphosphatase [Ignavibacteriales bacterium]
MIKLVVGSKNPVKVNAVKKGFQKVFPDTQFEIIGIDVPSNVSEQPMTNEETLQGAINRALNCKKSNPDANYYFGIEGGVDILNNQMEVFAWIYIVDNQGNHGLSRTASFFLPPSIQKLILQGMELGHADDLVFQRKNSKQQNGAVGMLTNNLIDRTKYYEEAVILALIPFINKELYQK